MTLTSLFSVAVYLAVMLVCIVAALLAHRDGAPHRHILSWALIGSCFVILMANRIGNIEHQLRETLRAALRDNSHLSYNDRWDLQAPLFVLVVVIALLLVYFAWRSWSRTRNSKRIRYLLAAQIAILAFLPLLALRLISLHATDELLYSGPIRLNWILDGLLTGIVGLSALLYIRRLRQKPQALHTPNHKQRDRHATKARSDESN
ncbi:hypothetical protein [Erythrobacter alti]|uniref:hypothetical protein n=1 Tax=Erythrobacter alti TaxID=1896145 RepID=UPI0030F4220D